MTNLLQHQSPHTAHLNSKNHEKRANERENCQEVSLFVQISIRGNHNTLITKGESSVQCGRSFYARFQRFGRAQDVDQAIAHYDKALKLCSPGHRNHARYLTDMALALFARFQFVRKMEDLDEAIARFREVSKLCHRSTSINNLACAIRTRFEQSHSMGDLNEAIICFRQVLNLRAPGHLHRYTSMDNLATAVYTRFKRTGRLEDVEEAILNHRRALRHRPAGHLGQDMFLTRLAAAILARFQQLKRVEDLDQAILYCRQALELRPIDHPKHANSLYNLALAIFTRFQQTDRSIGDLKEAISCLQDALKLRPRGHRDRADCLNNLAFALRTRFEQMGTIEDVEEAIRHHREVLELRHGDHVGRADCLDNLAVAIRTRFEQYGWHEDLEETIRYFRQALELATPEKPERGYRLASLGNAVHARFERQGRMSDIEEAITLHREALRHRPAGHPDYDSSLNDLATAVLTRFRRLARDEDIEEAITFHQEALKLRPFGHPNRGTSLRNLANAVLTRFEQTARIDDLQEAIRRFREAPELGALKVSNYGSSLALSNLATAVFIRFERLGNMKDLEEAIAHHQKALDLCPPGNQDRAIRLASLASVVHTRFEQLGRVVDLEEAIRYLCAAEATLSLQHPARTMIWLRLASSYLARPGPEYITDAFVLYRRAANHLSSGSKAQFDAALAWASAAHRHKHESVVSAYSKTLSLLDHCLIARPTVEQQQQFLATGTTVPKSLASDAAACAIDAGQLDKAVEMLEQGRCILWTKMRGYRNQLQQLHQVDSDLADKFKTVSVELEHLALSTASELSDTTPVSVDVKMQRHRILVEHREEWLKRIRRLDGFRDFLQAVPFTTLLAAADEGPVVVVNVSQHRSDAIILHNSGSPVLVPLPNVRPEDLARLNSQLVSAQSHDLANPSRIILSILRTLWEDVVYPVVERLDTLGVAAKSRIWWCPTSELCALPLHAAGPYLPKQKNLPDLYISSYTPTVTALIESRSGLARKSAVPKVLAIGQPGKTLPNVEAELNHLRAIGDFVNILIGEKATPDAVTEQLQTHSWAHFACHGHLNAQPFHSSFELRDNSRLTLHALMHARLPNAEFAYLASCHSAAGDIIGTPDETISLAGALQFCGFRSVVGTLWAMEDVDGPDLAQDFYSYMFRERDKTGTVNVRDSAKALNRAIQKMRKKEGMTLDRWIKFVHIGV